MSYTITVPVVSAVTFAPNPANINQSVTVTATISEITKTLEPQCRYCGEIQCGEA